MTSPTQYLFALRCYTGEQPTPPRSSVRLAKRRDEPVQKSRTLATATQPEQQPHFPMCQTPPSKSTLTPSRCWEMENHYIIATGFTLPVDSFFEAKPTTCRPQETRTRPSSTDRGTIPLFVTPSLQPIDPRWGRSPTESRAAVAPEI
ncbi:hypothetical protein Bca4012_013176 [Brassica carinata]